MHDGDCGAIGGMKTSRGNRSTRRKPTPALLCLPQSPHDQTRTRTGAAAGLCSLPSPLFNGYLDKGEVLTWPLAHDVTNTWAFTLILSIVRVRSDKLTFIYNDKMESDLWGNVRYKPIPYRTTFLVFKTIVKVILAEAGICSDGSTLFAEICRQIYWLLLSHTSRLVYMRKFRDHEKIDLEILINVYVLRTPLLPPQYGKSGFWYAVLVSVCTYACTPL
jgi:hypothetical protein